MTDTDVTTTERCHVIDALLDGERVDATALELALADADGRRYLVSIVALREVVGDSDIVDAIRPIAARGWTRGLGVAAALLLAAVCGYFAGHDTTRQANRDARQTRAAPPAPTRVIDLRPGVEWHDITGGH